MSDNREAVLEMLDVHIKDIRADLEMTFDHVDGKEVRVYKNRMLILFELMEVVIRDLSK